MYINVGRVEDPNFTGDKNCKYQEKEHKWEQEELWKSK